MSTNFKTTTLPQQQEQQDSSPRHKIVIAVDGPAASGKGTLARMLAERLNYACLDTGALYRAVAMTTLEMGGNPEKTDDALRALELIRPHMTPELLANPVLRTPEVSDAASKVAAIPDIRRELMDYQRSFAANPPGNVGGAVLDGRDIGTVICPEADVKFFVTATPEERARRRFEEMKKNHSGMTLAIVLQDIRERDQRDSTRQMAPAIPASDAHILDTTKLAPADVMDEAVALIHSKFLLESEPE